MKMVTIRCAEGRQVPLPDGTDVPPHDAEDGVTVPLDMFIERRLAAGDVVRVPAKPATPKKVA
ncbi:DUF2635 domain-containing protein [Falsiroseomonas sp.]|uniref:DUF2635 domain-containing protein n=1 Tax=Falsiroseomonas sp. TaxID=2870721 RepID=UPI0027235CA4|nr:DUF2635 domain-containing protein [Falsiroseomonas sp.]MDO9501391.1 DUF2635 domain-containing protein [Falsiroseomonas sp.]